jgi:tetratricopeptide (TPR) repeat protein
VNRLKPNNTFTILVHRLNQIIIGGYLPWDAPDLPDIPMTDANRVGYYAVELQNNEEYKRAEHYYEKAIEMDPNNASHLGKYAIFLKDVKQDYEGARTHGWNFEPDIEFATKAAHPDPTMLRKIADELTSTEPVTSVNK